MVEAVIFWILAIGTVCGALFVIVPPIGRSPLHSAISLIVCLFFAAGIFVMLEAHFIAALQVIVYAGAIMVLFIFVIMLLNLKKEELGEARITATKIVGGLAAALIIIKIIKVIYTEVTMKNWHPEGIVRPDKIHTFGSIQDVGVVLFKDFLFPFEIISILLFAAIIGAVIIAKRRLKEEPSNGSDNA